MDSKFDVVICGSGIAGVAAATWLAQCGIRCKILESRSGPLQIGQADGIQVRSVEICESFGLAEQLLKDAYHNIEVAFWGPGDAAPATGIVRKRSAHATTAGLSHMPRVILSQARFIGLWLENLKRLNGPEVDYRYKVTRVTVDEGKATDPNAHPVTVVTEKDGKEEVFEAKYCLASDGAHSSVRRSLGFKMVGETSDSVWGVMDVFPQTDFPDIRKQCIIQSDAGSIITIPREGGQMVRIYVELAHGTREKEVTLEQLQKAARQVFHPYSLDFADVRWWSAYAIGQRIADHFSKANRIFLTGDACHTHSPKAGQGMNVSLQDGYNIGWKLASVLKGHAGPELLETYVLERQKVADVLINWDRIWAKQMSSIAKEDGGVVDANGKIDFSEIFVKAEAFTAGLTVTYDDSSITHAESSDQQAAANLKVGMRLQAAQVVRFCDAKVMKSVNALPSDGRWRIMVFAGDVRQHSVHSRLEQLGAYLFSNHGPIRRYLPLGADIDNMIEVILIVSGDRLETKQEQIPDVFWPVTGKYGMRDLHKIYIDDESYHEGHGHAYEFYGIDPKQGAIAIVRPDQYVSKVLHLDNHEGIGSFFERAFQGKGQTNGSLRNGSLANGSMTNGTLTNGLLTNGTLTNGTLTNGTLTNGSLKKQTAAMHVIVVGAGPSGFSLSLVLARAGIRVTLLEKADEVGSQPRAAHMFTPGIRMLRRAGVLQDVRRAGFIPKNAAFRKADGTPIATIEDFSSSKTPDATTVLPIDVLGKILWSHAQKNNNISVKWGRRVLDVGQEEKSAWVTVRDNRGAEETIQADFVCGCDGASSQVRKSLFGIEFPGKTWDDQMVATNVYYPLDEWAYDDLNFFIDPEKWHIIGRLTRDGLWRVSYRADGSKTMQEILADQPARFEQLLPGNPKPEDYTIININPYKLHQRSAEKYRVGRICLAADAAHLCNPWGGLGLTGGFADVLGLSECLIGIHTGQADEGILDKYDEVRRSIYRDFIDPVSTSNFMRVSTSDPETALEKDPLLATIARMRGDPQMREQFDRHMDGILHDFTQYYRAGQSQTNL